MPRQNKGRQKIEMKRITNESNLLVAFSKRYAGHFKKASELCTLCGVEMAIIIFSPTKKVFSFGHPYVQSVLDHFLEQSHPSRSRSRAYQLVQHYRNSNIQELNMHLTNLLGQLEAEKKTSEELKKIRNVRQEDCWWDAPLEILRVEELEILKDAILELKKNSERQVERLIGNRWLTLQQ
ncbi:unnamed protein product [Lactuca saligna]|uniref:MADS-box domain-containing protein n=1 Tax=Lactuca saligna TaxID=75948 RepID=A0AA36DW11_LACSI|nr:unnamed protein product [Lactuca saligna]